MESRHCFNVRFAIVCDVWWCNWLDLSQSFADLVDSIILEVRNSETIRSVFSNASNVVIPEHD